MNAGVLPSRRLVVAGMILAAGSLALLAFPEALLLLVALNVCLAAAALLDLALTPPPSRLRITRRAPERVAVLRTQTVVIQIRNDSSVRLAVRVRDTVAAELRATPEELVAIVPANSIIELTSTIHPAARGRFPWGPIFLRYRSVLGLWERSRSAPAEGAIQVYPSIESVERYHLLARTDQLQTLGIRRLRIKGVSLEFESLREFVNGDDTRLMDWKATARRRKLIVRNQRAERNQSVLLLVDSGRLMTAEEGGVSKLDHAVNAALLLAHVGLSRGDRVGLCTFSHKVHTWLAPRAHVGQMRPLTEALYDLSGDFTESDHARCLRQIALRHNKRSLLVVLTDFVDADTAAEMVAAVRHAQRRHLVLFTAFNDPFVNRAARIIPHEGPEAFRKVVATELLRERREVLERLRQMGVQVVDAEPGGVTPRLLNKYLEISLRGLL